MDTDFHSELSVSLWYDILCVLCFLLCMFLLYITVLLPVDVIKDDDDKEALFVHRRVAANDDRPTSCFSEVLADRILFILDFPLYRCVSASGSGV